MFIPQCELPSFTPIQKQAQLFFCKCGRCIWLTTLSHSCAECLEILVPQPSGTLRGCRGLSRDYTPNSLTKCKTWQDSKPCTNSAGITLTMLDIPTLTPCCCHHCTYSTVMSWSPCERLSFMYSPLLTNYPNNTFTPSNIILA